MAADRKRRGVEPPPASSDRVDCDGLLVARRETAAPEVKTTHGRGEALAHAAAAPGVRARALALVGHEEEGN